MLSPKPSIPDSERPRERLLRHGAAVLTDAELLAVVLRTGTPGRPVMSLAHDILAHFTSLRGLFGAGPDTLGQVHGLGNAKICQLLSVLELARRAMREDLTDGCALDQPARVKQYCVALLGHHEVEHCMALYLDNRLRLIATGEVARGTLSQASVYPREVVRDALRHHAAALILAHNHPSGLAIPSEADARLTRHLKQALALVDVRLLDHLIVAGGTALSMAEQGRM
ncbi:MAG TPA: DNA repair protein RadC [Bordetella sp.]|jgi:DNA repair protein RadC|nr:DNA repair protein RadC [Bordetella sp.]